MFLPVRVGSGPFGQSLTDQVASLTSESGLIWDRQEANDKIPSVFSVCALNEAAFATVNSLS